MAEASRLKLREELRNVLEIEHTYYQPPASLKMNYPCVRYKQTGIDTFKADDRNYKRTNEYELIVIDANPDTDIPDRILDHFPMCRLNRVYTADNLYHFVLTLYY